MSKQAVCVLIILSFISIGCATTTKDTDRYLDIINTWKGRHIDKLVEKAGYPHQSFTGPDGHKVFVYTYVSSNATPKVAVPRDNPLMTLPPQESTDYCQTFFETDNNGIIVKCGYNGDACD